MSELMLSLISAIIMFAFATITYALKPKKTIVTDFRQRIAAQREVRINIIMKTILGYVTENNSPILYPLETEKATLQDNTDIVMEAVKKFNKKYQCDLKTCIVLRYNEGSSKKMTSLKIY